MSYWKW